MRPADSCARVAARAALVLALAAALPCPPARAQVEPSSRPVKPDLPPTTARSDSTDDDETPERVPGAVRGGSRPYYVQSPRGWTLLPPAGPTHGLVTTFGMPDEAGRVPTVAEGVTTCGVEATARPARDTTTLAQFAAAYTERIRQASPEMFVTRGDTLRTGDGRWTIWRKLQGFRAGNVLSVAFLEDERQFVVLVLNAATEARWKAALAAWREMVATYSSLGGKKRTSR